MGATLKQISGRTGVSLMTVSRALRGIGRVNAQTRQRVLAEARRLGYPGLDHVVIPRRIRSGRADHRLSLLLPTVTRMGSGVDSAFGQEVVAGLRERLAEIGGCLRAVSCPDLATIQKEFGDGMHGIVLRQRLPTAWVDVLRRQGPVVFAVSQDFQCGVDCVYTNEHRSAAMVLDYLTGRGHQSIGWFGIIDRNDPWAVPAECLDRATVSDWHGENIHGPRYAAWANLALCQVDHRKQPFLLLERNWAEKTLEDTVEAGLRKLLRATPRPTAIVVPTEAMGQALLSVAHKLRLRVPQDLSVVGYGGPTGRRAGQQVLTTVVLPMRLIGRAVPELVERRLANPAAVPISMQLETTLAEGTTVADKQKNGDLRQ